MTETTLKFVDHPDKCISYLEFVALKKFVFDGKAGPAYEVVDGLYTKSLSWTEIYSTNAKQSHQQILNQINNGSFSDM